METGINRTCLFTYNNKKNKRQNDPFSIAKHKRETERAEPAYSKSWTFALQSPNRVKSWGGNIGMSGKEKEAKAESLFDGQMEINSHLAIGRSVGHSVGRSVVFFFSFLGTWYINEMLSDRHEL